MCCRRAAHTAWLSWQVSTLEGELRTEQRAREALAAQLAEASQCAADAAADARAAARYNSTVAADMREVQQV
jgi:hypothetical protein